MQTAGGGLQVIRSVEFQERGAGKHLHIAHLVTPSMLLSFFVVIVIWLCVGEKGRNEKSSSFGGKRRWVHILGNCFSNAASWIYYDAGDDCQSWPLQASQVFRIVLSCDGLRKKESLGIPNWPQLWRGDPVIGKLQYLTFPDSCPVWKRLVWSRDIWSEFNKPLQASWKYLCSFVQIRLQIPCTSIMITCQRLYSKLPTDLMNNTMTAHY